MKRLYFVRHGESVINARRVWGARSPGELTPLGREQALAAGKKARQEKLKVDLIVSSPIERALETATIIAKELGYPTEKIVLSDLLMERSMGELEGTSVDDFFNNHPFEHLDEVPGSETVEQLQERAKQAHDYLRALPEDNIMVVSHSAFGRALRRAIKSEPHSDEYVARVSLPHAEVLVWVEEN